MDEHWNEVDIHYRNDSKDTAQTKSLYVKLSNCIDVFIICSVIFIVIYCFESKIFIK